MPNKLGLDIAENANNVSWVRTEGNVNPYSTAVIGGRVITTEVTSIPSPYARMHLFEIAFRQCANASDGAISDDLKKCVAHCLDVYELLFNCDGDKLRNEGIKIEQHKYKDVSLSELDSCEFNYLDALCIFRYGYGSELFHVFFTISHNENIIAATSPFTGFYTRQDNAETLRIDDKTYFSQEQRLAGQDLWLPLSNRATEFKKFIYLLVRFLRGLNAIDFRPLYPNDADFNGHRYIYDFQRHYKDFWAYIEQQITAKEKAQWDVLIFNTEYPEYDFSTLAAAGYGFPIHTQNRVWADRNIFIIPSGYDPSNLKYLLLPRRDASFNLCNADYNDDIMQRRNPISKSLMPWVSIDDFLDDKVVKVQGTINSDYYFTVSSPNNCSVIPPLKKRFFEFFKIEDLQNNVNGVLFEMSCDDAFTYCDFTLKVPYNIGGKVGRLTLTKHYSGDDCIRNREIYLGIYPFIKTPDNIDDFYRILVYSDLDFRFQDLEIIKFDGNKYISAAQERSVDNLHVRRKNDTNPTLQNILGNIVYYSLESTLYDEHGLRPHKDVSFDILNFKYDIQNLQGIEHKDLIIIPILKEVTPAAAASRIAIDLGTSNTYVAYSLGDNPIKYKSHNEITNDVQFVKFLKADKPDNMTTKIRYDFPHRNTMTQLCEFMPSYFADDSYHFPIPTMLNIKKVQNNDLERHAIGAQPLVSLYDVNIPFAYFEEGERMLGLIPLDKVVQSFKWFDANDNVKRGELYLYADQLCFMMRTNLLVNNISPTNAILYYTYPLAFRGVLPTLYKELWEKNYAKYFNISVNNEFVLNPATYREIAGQFVKNETESKTPVYSDERLVNAGMVVSIDVGGGSTDIMIYDTAGHTVQLCTSFKFAGDKLFGENVLNSQNVWFNRVAQPVINLLPHVGHTPGAALTHKKIHPDGALHDVNLLMNYEFSNPTFSTQVRIHCHGSHATTLISALHSSAIIFKVAQVCRSRGCRPNIVFFSGNGSKLLYFSQDADATFGRSACLDSMVRLIYSKIFPNDVNIINGGIFNVIESRDPKAATAEGTLKAVAANVPGFGTPLQEYYVSLGRRNGGDLYAVNPITMDGPIDSAILNADFEGTREIYTDIVANIDDFMTFFFDTLIAYFNSANLGYTYCKENPNSRNINGKLNIYNILAVEYNSFENGYQRALNTAVAGPYYESLFLAIVSQIITDLCKALNP